MVSLFCTLCQIHCFSSTNHSIFDLSTGNERDEACAHFALSESKNETLENEKSLIEIRFAFGSGAILV